MWQGHGPRASSRTFADHSQRYGEWACGPGVCGGTRLPAFSFSPSPWLCPGPYHPVIDSPFRRAGAGSPVPPLVIGFYRQTGPPGVPLGVPIFSNFPRNDGPAAYPGQPCQARKSGRRANFSPHCYAGPFCTRRVMRDKRKMARCLGKFPRGVARPPQDFASLATGSPSFQVSDRLRGRGPW